MKIKWRLCHNCLAKYGDKAAEWPEWLQEWMRSMNNEVNHNRRNYELELYDEYATDVIEGARMSKAVDVSDSYDMTKPAGMKWNVSTTRSIAVSKERDKTENSILINELLQGLTEREREVIELHYYDDLTQAEVGRALGISQVMVSKIIAAVIKRARNGSNKG